MLFLLTSVALAGKLSEDFRGLEYGVRDLPTAPLAGCEKGVEKGVGWSCPTTLAGVSVIADYFHQYGVFFAVSFHGVISPGDAQLILAALEGSWGPPAAPKNASTGDVLATWMWLDGEGRASFRWEPVQGAFRVHIQRNDLYQEMLERQKTIAIEASKGDL